MAETQILGRKEIQKRLADRKLLVIREKTGISYTTLKKLRDGEGANHTIDTLERVSNYLTKNDAPKTQ